MVTLDVPAMRLVESTSTELPGKNTKLPESVSPPAEPLPVALTPPPLLKYAISEDRSERAPEWPGMAAWRVGVHRAENAQVAAGVESDRGSIACGPGVAHTAADGDTAYGGQAYVTASQSGNCICTDRAVETEGNHHAGRRI